MAVAKMQLSVVSFKWWIPSKAVEPVVPWSPSAHDTRFFILVCVLMLLPGPISHIHDYLELYRRSTRSESFTSVGT